MSQTMKRDAREAMPATEPRDAEQAGVVEAFSDMDACDGVARGQEHVEAAMMLVTGPHRNIEWRNVDGDGTVILGWDGRRLVAAALMVRDDANWTKTVLWSALAASPPPQPTPEAREAGDGWLERLEERASLCEERAANLRKGAGSLVAARLDDHRGRMLRQADAFMEEAADLRIAITRARAADAAEAALREITELERKPFEYPADHSDQIAACSECQRYKGHPIQQGICDAHRKPFYDHESHDRYQQEGLIYRAKDIARALLTGSKQ